jgi:hypothetical protein
MRIHVFVEPIVEELLSIGQMCSSGETLVLLSRSSDHLTRCIEDARKNAYLGRILFYKAAHRLEIDELSEVLSELENEIVLHGDNTDVFFGTLARRFEKLNAISEIETSAQGNNSNSGQIDDPNFHEESLAVLSIQINSFKFFYLDALLIKLTIFLIKLLINSDGD